MRRNIPIEVREEARVLRTAGIPLKRIASRLQVSPSTVHNWTRDIELTPDQQLLNLRGPFGPHSPEHIARLASNARDRRAAAQMEGRQRARRRNDSFHQTGCMLYWAEGAKGRNQIRFANSDVAMMRLFRVFLWDCLGIEDDAFRLRINAYTNNGLTIEEIEMFWLTELDLPKSSVRTHTVNHYPTSSSGRSKTRLVHGVCELTINSTHAVQHVFGAIQEYAGFEEPKWLG